MDRTLLVEADRIVASLSPGRRESVREIVHDAARRGALSPSGRRFLHATTGSTLVADLLDAAIAESSGQGSRAITSTGELPPVAQEAPPPVR